MKRAMRFGAMIGCFAVSLGLDPASAQTEQAPDAEPLPRSSGEAQANRETVRPADPRTSAAARRDPRERTRSRLADRLHRLRTLMTQELQLSTSQNKSIGELIDVFIRDSLRPKPATGGEPANSKELQDLRQRIYDARKAGDNAQAVALRSQWIKLRYAEIASEEADLATFLDKIEATLSQTQRDRFPRLVDRAGLRPRLAAGGNTLAALTGTLRHPSLELSGEQQATVRRIVREEIQKVPRDERRHRGMDSAVPAIRKRVMEELSPAQRSRFEALLKGVESNDATKGQAKSRPAPPTQGVKPGDIGSDTD